MLSVKNVLGRVSIVPALCVASIAALTAGCASPTEGTASADSADSPDNENVESSAAALAAPNPADLAKAGLTFLGNIQILSALGGCLDQTPQPNYFPAVSVKPCSTSANQVWTLLKGKYGHFLCRPGSLKFGPLDFGDDFGEPNVWYGQCIQRDGKHDSIIASWPFQIITSGTLAPNSAGNFSIGSGRDHRIHVAVKLTNAGPSTWSTSSTRRMGRTNGGGSSRRGQLATSSARSAPDDEAVPMRSRRGKRRRLRDFSAQTTRSVAERPSGRVRRASCAPKNARDGYSHRWSPGRSTSELRTHTNHRPAR